MLLINTFKFIYIYERIFFIRVHIYQQKNVSNLYQKKYHNKTILKENFN